MKSEDELVLQLLVVAGAISQDQLEECAGLARRRNLPVDMLLTTAGYVTQKQIAEAHAASNAILDLRIEAKVAVESLKTAFELNVSFKEALVFRGDGK